MRRNDVLHAKLDAQIRAHRDIYGKDPDALTLSHDEIDEWRAQFDGAAIPVAILAYKHIPIIEQDSAPDDPVTAREVSGALDGGGPS